MSSLKRQKEQRGFALLMVVMIVALVTVISAALLDIVQVDVNLTGHQRRASEAKALADGAAMEAMESEDVITTIMESIAGLPADVPFDAPDDSYFVRAQTADTWAHTYSGTARRLRMAPLPETSLDMRAYVYEVEIDASVMHNGRTEAQSEVRTEVYQIAQMKGSVMRPLHAR